jgi:hypothetical protein
MAPLPMACSACRQPFALGDPRRRLVSLEGKLALCSECDWRITHPEAPKHARSLAAYGNLAPTWIATALIGFTSN